MTILFHLTFPSGEWLMFDALDPAVETWAEYEGSALTCKPVGSSVPVATMLNVGALSVTQAKTALSSSLGRSLDRGLCGVADAGH